MSYLASITAWIAAWGPVGIGSIALISGLVLLVGLSWAQSLRAKADEKRSLSKLYTALQEQPKTINPLADYFEKTRISAQDYFSPLNLPNRNKQFRDCEFIGPGTVALTNSHFDGEGIRLQQCNVMFVKPSISSLSLIVFERCTFINCTFYKCTMCFVKGQPGCDPPDETVLNPD